MPNDTSFPDQGGGLASFIAGPSAAVILSDFGADVIKVEPRAVTYGECEPLTTRSRSPRMPTPGTSQSQQARHRS